MQGTISRLAKYIDLGIYLNWNWPGAEHPEYSVKEAFPDPSWTYPFTVVSVAAMLRRVAMEDFMVWVLWRQEREFVYVPAGFSTSFYNIAGVVPLILRVYLGFMVYFPRMMTSSFKAPESQAWIQLHMYLFSEFGFWIQGRHVNGDACYIPKHVWDSGEKFIVSYSDTSRSRSQHRSAPNSNSWFPSNMTSTQASRAWWMQMKALLQYCRSMLLVFSSSHYPGCRHGRGDVILSSRMPPPCYLGKLRNFAVTTGNRMIMNTLRSTESSARPYPRPPSRLFYQIFF